MDQPSDGSIPRDAPASARTAPDGLSAAPSGLARPLRWLLAPQPGGPDALESLLDARVATRLVALAYLCAATLGVPAALLTLPPDTSYLGTFAVIAIAYSVPLATLATGGRRPRLTFNLALAAGTVLITGASYFTGLYPVAYVWVALFAFYVGTRREAILQAALIAVAYAILLAVRPPPGAPDRWFDILGTVVVAGLVVALLRHRVERLLAGLSDALRREEARTRELTESEERTRQILDGAHEAYVEMDEGGRILEWNLEAERTFGWSCSEAIGRALADTILPQSLRGIQWGGLSRFIETGGGGLLDRRLELPALRRDGHEFPVELTISSLSTESGRRFHAFLHDISERRQASEDLARSERRFRTLTTLAPVSIFETDADGACRFVNQHWCTLSGMSAEEALGNGWIEALHEQDRERVMREWRAAMAEGREFSTEHRYAHDGRVRWIETRAVPMTGRGGVHGYLGTSLDVTERKRSEETLRAKATDLAVISEATGALARGTDRRTARPTICETARRLGLADVALLWEPTTEGNGLRISAMSGASFDPGVLPLGDERSRAVAAFMSGELEFIADVHSDRTVSRRLVHATGVVSCCIQPLLREGQPLGVLWLGWRSEVTALPQRIRQLLDLFAAEAALAIQRENFLHQLAEAAQTDPLTGLPNRRAWDDQLPRELSRASRHGEPLSVALLDLDRFKDFNDRHGHQAGDRLLRAAGVAWARELRSSDVLARFGGEEFAVLLPRCRLPEALRLVERLRLATPRGVTVSVGVAAWDGAEQANDLIGRADSALYRAKSEGRNRAAAA